MQNIIKSVLFLGAVSVFQMNALANCGCDIQDTKHGNFYLGLEGGISLPVKRTFKEKMKSMPELKYEGELSKSSMYGAILGYRFYPKMAAEFNFQRKPSYKLKITTPTVPVPVLGSIPSGNSTTKVHSDLYLLGLVYDLPQLGQTTPYVGFDFGVARIKNTATDIYSTLPMLGNVAVVHIRKNSMKAPVFQFNLGITTHEIIPNTQFYAATRLQIIKGVKIKYDTINPITREKTPDSFKKTIGVGEFVVGMTYDLPW